MDNIKNFVGNDTYIALLKKYNLCTKKWTRGRTKGFYKELNNLVRKKLKKMRKEVSDDE